MLISPRKKFAFVHIPKNAGSSISQVIKTYTANIPNSYMHASIRDVEIPEGYKTFAFVRNPWDMMVSIYTFSKKRYEEYPRRYENMKGYDQLNWEFEDWLMKGKMWNDNYRSDEIAPVQTRSQSYYLTKDDKKLVVDRVGKFENLEKDLNDIISWLGIRGGYIPHTNATDHKHYHEYYSQKSIDFIAKHFKWDIENFDYEF